MMYRIGTPLNLNHAQTSEDKFMEFLIFLAGAAWRVWDGSGIGPNVVRIGAIVLLAPLAVFLGSGLPDPSGWYSVGEQVAMGLAAIGAVAALTRGFDDWTSPLNTLHFWPALVGAFPLFALSQSPVNLAIYTAMVLVSGACYPVLGRLADWHKKIAPNSKYTFQYTMVCEAISGGLLIGGLTIIS